MAHQAGAYPGFYSMKQLRVLLLPPPSGWDASPSQGYPWALSLLVPIYTPVWRLRHCESKVWLTQEHNSTQCPRPGLEPGPLALESSTLTMRPLNLPPYIMTRPKFQCPIYNHSAASVPKHNFRKSNFFLNNMPVQFKTKVQKPYPFYERNGPIWYP